MPPSLISMLSIQVRRVSPPEHLSYPWQRPPQDRRRPLGAGVIDADAFQRAWDNAMPVDSFTTTHKE